MSVKHASVEVMPRLLNGELLDLLTKKGITLVYQQDADYRPYKTLEEFLRATSQNKIHNEQDSQKNRHHP